jgi:hypothetical protein
MDFGTSAGDIPLVRSVTVVNHLQEAVKILDVALNAPEQAGFSYKSECPQTLAPEGLCSVVVTWQPTAKGLAQGVLAVKHSGKGGLVQTELKGLFQPPPPEVAAKEVVDKVDLAPTSLDFGTSAGGIALVRSVVVSNNSSKDVDVWDVSMDVPQQSGFSYDSQCPESLKPGETCNIVVTWQPTSKGLAQGLLVVEHSGKAGMAQTELKGTYTPPTDVPAKEVAEGKVSATPDSLDFGSSPGGISAVRSVVLTNNSAKDLSIKNVVLDVPEQSGFTDKSECPDTLLPGKACNIFVTWMPTTKGTAQGVLVVQHSGMTGMTQVEIKGTLAPESGKTAAIYPDIVPERGLLVSDREKIEFGDNIKEESAITATLVNAGSSALTLKSIKLSGVKNDLDISDTGCAPETVLKPGEACPLTISWLPTHGGTILDSLQITHTGARGVLVIPVKGSADKSLDIDETGGAISTGGGSSGGGASTGTGTGTSTVSFQTTSGGAPIADSGSSLPAGKTMKQIFGRYKITSHSAQRAVINGPDGSQVVRDGENLIMEGVDCTVAIVPTGVILSSEGDKVMLPFDTSLKLLDAATLIVVPPTATTQPPATATTQASPPPAPAGPASLMPPNLPH